MQSWEWARTIDPGLSADTREIGRKQGHKEGYTLLLFPVNIAAADPG